VCQRDSYPLGPGSIPGIATCGDRERVSHGPHKPSNSGSTPDSATKLDTPIALTLGLCHASTSLLPSLSCRPNPLALSVFL
jgi:hypothetical protein